MRSASRGGSSPIGADCTRATSRDGTSIAVERVGGGPRLVLVDGALCHRGFGPSAGIARALAGRFEVVRYDRRGRGGSGPEPGPLQREVEDLTAVIEHVGGVAGVFGLSSGAVLALAAVAAGAPIPRLALYEAPFVVDDSHAPMPPGFVRGIRHALDAGRPGEAVRAFLRLVGAPAPAILVMRLLPAWKKLCAVAATLPYDLELVEPHYRGLPFPPGAWDAVTVPTLVLHGGKSPGYMKTSARALASALPRAESAELPGQTHMVRPKELARALVPFFAAPASATVG